MKQLNMSARLDTPRRESWTVAAIEKVIAPDLFWLFLMDSEWLFPPDASKNKRLPFFTGQPLLRMCLFVFDYAEVEIPFTSATFSSSLMFIFLVQSDTTTVTKIESTVAKIAGPVKFEMTHCFKPGTRI